MEGRKLLKAGLRHFTIETQEQTQKNKQTFTRATSVSTGQVYNGFIAYHNGLYLLVLMLALSPLHVTHYECPSKSEGTDRRQKNSQFQRGI